LPGTREQAELVTEEVGTPERNPRLGTPELAGSASRQRSAHLADALDGQASPFLMLLKDIEAIESSTILIPPCDPG